MRASAPRDFLTDRPFAHRGLHKGGVPENSLAAVRDAIAAGYGVECDVRLSRDGIAYVFHDRRTDRLTGRRGRFAGLAADMRQALRLMGSEEAVPSLSALLALTGTQTPLLIELKSDDGPHGCARLCAAVARDLSAHRGALAAVMSFDPLMCHWFARHRPDVARGLVIGRRHRTGITARRDLALAIARAMPHFIACDVRDLPKARAIPRRRRLPLLCWTVRSARDRLRAHDADQIIFEMAS
ncbi:glycerophosphodiester phosphodiesterase family protein [Sphingobium nicotianae]|uniref:Glycerophosphodiester phosphodiesterase n=1 Tax=Sphingobium nicotianae TaxID=2782607 RepID=A0A9X1IQA1_9SPHN|nr:glycerophosphodiester phosphodiesterase family protein [Sphingobium nicotianae]MBT2186390.1 glycerophosphodiester phosphodiesterase [Sphingobium nicotianae]